VYVAVNRIVLCSLRGGGAGGAEVILPGHIPTLPPPHEPFECLTFTLLEVVTLAVDSCPYGLYVKEFKPVK
jgi:hypothetical protein